MERSEQILLLLDQYKKVTEDYKKQTLCLIEKMQNLVDEGNGIEEDYIIYRIQKITQEVMEG